MRGGGLLVELLRLTDVLVLSYFLLLNFGYLVLVGLAGAEFVRHLRHRPFAGEEQAYQSPLTLAVSVLMPAYNEEAGIVSAVQAITALRYPAYEVVVIDDGSTDATFDRLRDAFDLVEIQRVIPDEIAYRAVVQSVHVARDTPDSLVVVRKRNGGKSDALNVGVNLARYPLVCMVDADSVLDPDALLAVAKPFADDPLRVAAAGGVVRVANGCRVLAGRVVDIRMPSQWVARLQVIEYLRAFLIGRSGWSRLGGLVVISGAFGMFRRDLVIEAGGLAYDCIGEDAELVVRLHRYLREHGRDYRIVFVPGPVSWSEAPSGVRVLARQRQRWHRGITEILIKHRAMLGHPRFGRIGLVALPYYLVFEFFAPVVELSALVLVPLGLYTGAIDLNFAWRFLLVAYGFALVVSLIAVAVEEVSFHRYHRWRDLGVVLVAAALENVGYRQATAVWRLRGAWAALRRHHPHWGKMTRVGFQVLTAGAAHGKHQRVRSATDPTAGDPTAAKKQH